MTVSRPPVERVSMRRFLFSRVVSAVFRFYNPLHARVGRLLERQKKSNCMAGEDVHLYPESRIDNLQGSSSAIKIGAHSHVRGQLQVFPHGGTITIGESCYVGEGSRLWSGVSIFVGDRVLISHGVNVHDSDSHSLSAEMRYLHCKQIFTTSHPAVLEDVSGAPIVIEDDAWICFNATLLKGIRVGKGAVVAAASVVTKDVPAYTVVAGNPAKVVSQSRP